MILTITPNPAVDQTVQIEEDLEAGRVQRSTGAQFDSGGNGINVSQFLRAFDAETVATGITGGFTGYFIEQDLADYDVPTDFVGTDEPTRLNTTIHAAGNEYKLNQSGPDVDPSIVDDIIATAQDHDPDVLNIGGSLPPGLSSDAVDRIASAGDWETALDIHGEQLVELDHGAEYVKPNEVELEAATGVDIDSIDDCAQAARELQSMGFERVLASMGSEGAMLVTPEETLYAPALDVDAVDTVGAGDSMFAGALWAYEQGRSDEDALKTAVSVSSQVVEVHGPSARDLDPEARIDDVRLWSMR
ncbi:1-phosphofructokinase [Halococcoides cellulosivorans]|uniref:1-phosphofructokinase n=1 Tax=Halococcoides cellulosivorans TaxID=1679096 RepID=A0A2R4WYA0_9EURY|nr:1-phosphofructokinase [Halococcoides cellulosivorans]AWB26500.1 1-phosphofructokinase [Halococcoides cellulosivorans]